jgi:tRNA A-37 threonylcarbamoyl transferase component Bud32
MQLDSTMVANLFLIIIYAITLLIYNEAKKDYTGGKIGYVINLITLTIVFLFLSDYVEFALEYLEYESIFSFNILCRVIALAILAFGGIKFISKKGLTSFFSGKKSTSGVQIVGTDGFSEKRFAFVPRPEISDKTFETVNETVRETTPPRDVAIAPDEEVTSPSLGRYEIIEEIGRGAMGMVYEARDPKLNRRTAIKTVNFAEDFDPDEITELKKRFLTEAETVAKLTHPNIVTIYDVGEEFEILYVAMEYAGDRNLEAYCKRKNLLPIRMTIDIVAQIADALSYAHKNGIVHRDIKPANILVLPDKKIKITDFGIAKSVMSSKTKSGVVKGTPLYMAPEQISGQEVDGRCDIFSLGIIFYQLLTGELPFTGDDFAALMYKITTVKHESPKKYNRKIFPACEQIIDKALEKDPKLRYQSAKSMTKHLRLLSRKMDDLLEKKKKA